MATIQMTPEQRATANMGGKFTSSVNPNDTNLTLEQLNAAYAKELEGFKAQTAAQIKADQAKFDQEQAELNQMLAQSLKADSDAFAKARAEIEAMAAQEQESIRQQTADYQAAQDRIRAETQAQAQAAALEQAKIQKQIADVNAQREQEAAKAKSTMEGMQRESAEKVAASKKAGRTAGARPLLGAATPAPMGERSQSLGNEASLGVQGGTLGANQTLGV